MITNKTKSKVLFCNPLAVCQVALFCLGGLLPVLGNTADLQGPEQDQQFQRGKNIFKSYCSNCHGEQADGRGKTLRLYMKLGTVRPSNFQIKYFSQRPDEYLMKIIREGGEKNSLSKYMPPFGYELTTAQIKDVVYFIKHVSKYGNEDPGMDGKQAQQSE